jgi:hypothetical protein
VRTPGGPFIKRELHVLITSATMDDMLILCPSKEQDMGRDPRTDAYLQDTWAWRLNNKTRRRGSASGWSL